MPQIPPSRVPQDLERIKSNVASMVDQGAPEVEIDEYLSSEGVTAAQLRSAPPVSAPPQNMAQQSWQPIQGMPTSSAETGTLGNEGAESYQLRQDGNVAFRFADGREQSIPLGDLAPEVAGPLGEQYRRLYGEEPPLAVSVSDTPGERPESFVRGVGEGIANVGNRAAGWLEAGLEAVGLADPLNAAGEAIGLAPSVGAAVAAQRANAATAPTVGSGFGRFVGEAIGSSPLAALPVGNVVQGGIGGALMSDPSEGWGQTVFNGLSGAATAGVLSGVVNAAANRVAPLRRTNLPENLQTLYDAGVRVTPGQYARGVANAAPDDPNAANSFVRNVSRRMARFEDATNRQPGVGGVIDSGRQQGLEDFARATIDRTLEPLGERLPRNLSGRRAIRFAGDRLSQRYDDVTNNIGEFAGDQQFVDELDAIQQQAVEMLPQRREQLNSILGGLGRFFANGTTLDGAALKRIETRLGDRIRRLTRSTDADQHDLADALDMARSAVRDLAGRAYPQYAAELQALNRGWAGLVQVERAALTGKGGSISPNSYSNAVRATESTTRQRGYARGEALNQDLADAASEVLPSELPDSGTATRLNQTNLLGLATTAAYSLPYGLISMATRGARIPPAGPSSPQASSIANLLRLGGQASGVLAPGVAASLGLTIPSTAAAQNYGQ